MTTNPLEAVSLLREALQNQQQLLYEISDDFAGLRPGMPSITNGAPARRVRQKIEAALDRTANLDIQTLALCRLVYAATSLRSTVYNAMTTRHLELDDFQKAAATMTFILHSLTKFSENITLGLAGLPPETIAYCQNRAERGGEIT